MLAPAVPAIPEASEGTQAIAHRSAPYARLLAQHGRRLPVKMTSDSSLASADTMHFRIGKNADLGLHGIPTRKCMVLVAASGGVRVP